SFLIEYLRSLAFVSFFRFSFYVYFAPRDLPSFPTRRSSDLLTPHNVTLVTANGDEVVIQPEETPARIPTTTTPVGEVNGIPLVEDRKSTRLNSSHVKISYAVFCLKKKKND